MTSPRGSCLLPDPDRPATGTILAFDFGLRRIGVAVGELTLGHARALLTIDCEASDARFAAIQSLIAEWQPVLLAVGLPRSLDGTEHELTARCRRFANQLRGRYGLPVELVDETLSSVAAEEQLREAGVPPHRRKARLDAVAAQIILQSYFDASS